MSNDGPETGASEKFSNDLHFSLAHQLRNLIRTRGLSGLAGIRLHDPHGGITVRWKHTPVPEAVEKFVARWPIDVTFVDAGFTERELRGLVRKIVREHTRYPFTVIGVGARIDGSGLELEVSSDQLEIAREYVRTERLDQMGSSNVPIFVSALVTSLTASEGRSDDGSSTVRPPEELARAMQPRLATRLRRLVRKRGLPGLAGMRLHDSHGGITIYWKKNTLVSAAVKKRVAKWPVPATFVDVEFTEPELNRLVRRIVRQSAQYPFRIMEIGPNVERSRIDLKVPSDYVEVAQAYIRTERLGQMGSLNVPISVSVRDTPIVAIPPFQMGPHDE